MLRSYRFFFPWGFTGGDGGALGFCRLCAIPVIHGWRRIAPVKTHDRIRRGIASLSPAPLPKALAIAGGQSRAPEPVRLENASAALP